MIDRKATTATVLHTTIFVLVTNICLDLDFCLFFIIRYHYNTFYGMVPYRTKVSFRDMIKFAGLLF